MRAVEIAVAQLIAAECYGHNLAGGRRAHIAETLDFAKGRRAKGNSEMSLVAFGRLD